MSAEDRRKWNERYGAVERLDDVPSRVLQSLDDILLDSGKTLDIGGGSGRNAIWLASRGLEVTVADISQVGLGLVERRFADTEMRVDTLCLDLETEPLPTGPWNLVTSILFLHRPLIEKIAEILTPGGLFVLIQPTMSNLTQYSRPPKDFLLKDGEAPELVRGLEVIRYCEGWLEDGRHDALLVARRESNGDAGTACSGFAGE